MFGTLKGRILIILAVVGIAAGFLYKNGIKRGLDLQGGMYLSLEVSDPTNTMTKDAKKDATDQAMQVIRNRIDQFGVSEPLVQKIGDDRIVVELPGIRDEDRAKAIIERTAFLEFKHVKATREFVTALPRIDRAIIAAGAAAAPAVDTTKADTGAAKPAGKSAMDILFQAQKDSAKAKGDTTSADSADAALPSAGDKTHPFGGLLMESGSEGEFLVADADKAKIDRYLALPEVQRLLPRNTSLLWSGKPVGRGAELYHTLFVLEGGAFMKGSALQDAQAGRDNQFGQTIVSFQLNRRGGRTFEKETGRHIGDRIAIILDNAVQSAPVVQGQIGANGQIEMGQSPMEEARDLALVLRAGALPAPIHIIEQRSVGPSLGQDSIDKGKMAGIVGILLVVLIMIGIYRFSGFLAVVALGVYVLLVLGGLSAFGAALTAPGIAGFILSIGMAVDANVLIFERTREELLAGKSVRLAVDDGFHHAMSAIIDSNLTTVITGLILYEVGTGPVRGFAVTLVIGVLASFFSAVFVTRTFMLLYLQNRSGSQQQLSI
ncbi:MAG TPA: protein translocase subunit SecD [Longimicrobiales bacterium]|nr:protein translocase subunit SecD [Longimicrobiales bacterium]